MTQLYETDKTPAIARQSVDPNYYSDSALFWSLGMGMVPRVNKSAAGITTGEVVVDDLTNARGVTTSTTAGDLRTVYVVPKLLGLGLAVADVTIAVDDEAPLYGPGAWVPHCDLDATAVSIHEYLKHSSTAKKLTGTGVIASGTTPPPVGTCAIAQAAKGAGAGQIAVMLLQTAGGIGGRAMATTAPTQGQLVGYNGSTWLPVGGMYLISDTELGVAAASFDLTSIPQTFKHLRLIMRLRTSSAGAGDSGLLRINNDSGANYNYVLRRHWHSAQYATTEGIGATSILFGAVASDGQPAGTYGQTEALIGDYTDSVMLPEIRIDGVEYIAAGTGAIQLHDTIGVYRTAGAVSRITILPSTGPNFMAGSRVSLYGLS